MIAFPINSIIDRLAPLGFQARVTSRTTWYVDYNDTLAVDGGGYGQYTKPFKTLAYAAGQVAAGDLIILKYGHTESIDAAAAIALATAGVTVVGEGEGNSRPTITVGTSATTATIYVTAANVTFRNLIFTTGVDSLVRIINVGDGGYRFKCIDCKFIEGSSKQWLDAVDFSHANTSGGKVLDCEFISTAAGATGGVKLGAATDDIEVDYCRFVGDFSSAAIRATAAASNCKFGPNNRIHNTNAAGRPIVASAAITGVIDDSGSVAALASNIGTAANRLTVNNDLRIVEATLVSSGITQAAKDLTNAVVGNWYIENIVCSTGSSGLATGTNFQIAKASGSNGLLNVLVETVANLGANKTVDLFTAGVTKQRTVLLNGEKLQYNSTAADCTGAGTIRVTVILRKIPTTAAATAASSTLPIQV